MSFQSTCPEPLAVVTGAASGIGRASAVKLSVSNSVLVLVDCNEEGLEETASLCNCWTELVAKDINNAESELQRAIAKYGRVKSLVNCAGINPKFVSIREFTLEYFDLIFNANVKGIFVVTKAVLGFMDRGSAIVNIASSAGHRGSPNLSVYCASKHAVIGLTKSLALELGPRGIRVNALAPGVIKTPTNLSVTQGGEALTKAVQSTGLGRLGTADDCASAIQFFLTDGASYINGAVLNIDGAII